MQYRWDDFSLDRENTLSTRQGQHITVARGTMRHRMSRWRARFIESGVETLNKVLLHSGGPRKTNAERHEAWLTLLRQLDRKTPKENLFHRICDNNETHKKLNVTERSFSVSRLIAWAVRYSKALPNPPEESRIASPVTRDSELFFWTAKANGTLQKYARGPATLRIIQTK